MTSTLLQQMTFAERAAYSGRMTVIGIGAVFGVLALLWGALVVFRMLITKGADSTSATPAAPAAKQAAPVAPAPVASAPVAPADDGALIAAITAAVAASMAEENGGVCPSFRVVSFTKAPLAKEIVK